MAEETPGVVGANGATEAAGMPQLEFSTFPNQIFWLAVTLTIIYLILSRVALPRIGAVLAQRSGAITHDLAAAEELKQKAIEAEEAYDQALADARAEAQVIIAATKAEIQKDLDVATAKADAEIAAKAAESEKAIAAIRENALESVTEIAKDVTKALVAAVSPVSADARMITTAVKARLKG